jgi:arsenate reductase
VAKLNVLFVCVGNAFRSQMAEAFARALGADLLEVESAGLAPVADLPAITVEIMAAHGIDASPQYPKGLDEVDLAGFDLIVNMSGYPLRVDPRVPVLEWEVPDPVGCDRSFHEQVAREIETRVRELIESLRHRRL